MKIQKPTVGRIVEFTAFRGHTMAEVDVYAGIIVKVHDGGVVDLCTLGSNSVYHNHSVRYDADGASNTWRYPPRCTDEIEI